MQHEGGWKQTEERGEWEIVYISRKQGKQENKIQLPGEWGCLKQATFILTPFCYLKIRVYIGFSMLLTQRARNSTSAAALGDKLPAKIHFATCWRVRGNDDFPPARCQTGPGSPLVFSPMQGQQGRCQLWAVPQLWWQSWFSTWPYSWSVICKWAPCPLQSCATERISSTEAFLLCTKQANALTFTQTLELAQVHPNRFFPRLSSQILFAPPIKSHWFLLPLNLPLPECFWAVLRGNKKTTVGFHTSELSTASFLKVFNSLFLTFLFFQIPASAVAAQLWGRAGTVSFAGIHLCPEFCSAPPFPQTHYPAMDWAFLGIHHLVAICQPRLPSAEDIWRGILSPWGVTKQTRLSEQTPLNDNENCGASSAAGNCKSPDKSVSPADPNNVCWGWWLILLLKKFFSSSIPANEVGLLEWRQDSRPGQLGSSLRLERGSSGCETKDTQSSRILLLCQQTDPANC